MKKQTLLFLAGGLMTFAACTNEPAANSGYTQEQLDSAVNARIAEMQAEMQASNDSAINALAQWKADSMIAAAKGQTPTASRPTGKNTRPTTPSTTTTPEPTKPATVGNGKPSTKGDQEPGTVGNGKPSMKNPENKKDGTIGNGKPSTK